MQSTDIPTWVGILSFVVGLAIVVIMGKWVASRERKKSPIKVGNKD